MYVSRLEYDNFRNLSAGSFSPCREINVIFGDNAQGKTNLIEAIWLFCGQKSFRGVRDFQLVNQDNSEQGARLRLDFYAHSRQQSAELTIARRREATLNGVRLKAAAELAESFAAVIFSPADMNLVNDGPAVRRRFLDSSLCMLRPKYQSALSMYNRAVMQRNAVLRDVRYHSELFDILDSFEGKIAGYGSYITAQRRQYIDALLRYAPNIYEGISEQRERLGMRYSATVDGGAGELAAALREARREDIKTGSTSVGPHRDDFELFINEREVKVFGSQGQRRSAVIAIKLAEAEILKKYTDEQPIAVLDDVMSELDASRQDYILNHIKGWQVFITCCDESTVALQNGGASFRMKNGVLSEN